MNDVQMQIVMKAYAKRKQIEESFMEGRQKALRETPAKLGGFAPVFKRLLNKTKGKQLKNVKALKKHIGTHNAAMKHLEKVRKSIENTTGKPLTNEQLDRLLQHLADRGLGTLPTDPDLNP